MTMIGTSLNEMMALIREQQATIVSQQADIEALKQFVGMDVFLGLKPVMMAT